MTPATPPTPWSPRASTTPWSPASATRLQAVERAEQRLADGTFGLSVRSGKPIPDERLEVAPTAELTVEEASSEQ